MTTGASPATTRPSHAGTAVEVLEIADGLVVAVRSVLNPDKLERIPPR